MFFFCIRVELNKFEQKENRIKRIRQKHYEECSMFIMSSCCSALHLAARLDNLSCGVVGRGSRPHFIRLDIH